MIIAVEGMDGAGKTTISSHIERKYGFINVEKPCKYLYADERGVIDYDKFKRDLKRVYDSDSATRRKYFGEGNKIAVTRFEGADIVLDRHIASNFYWNHDPKSRKSFNYFNNLVKECGTPDLTIFLYATPKERYRRLKKRNPNDVDLKDDTIFEDGTPEHIDFLRRFNFNYVMIDTNGKTIQEVCREVDHCISRLMYNKQDGDSGYAYKIRRGDRKSVRRRAVQKET